MKILSSETLLEYMPDNRAFAIRNYSIFEIDGELQERNGFYGWFDSEEKFDEFYMDVKKQFKDFYERKNNE